MEKYPQPNKDGEKIINEFCTYLRVGTRVDYDEKTIEQYRRDIWNYWEITEFRPLKNFNVELAKFYRDSIGSSVQTKKQKIKRVAEFFRWLFKAKLTSPTISEALSVLRLSKKEKGMLSKQEVRNYPSLNEFEQIIDFEINDDIDFRDKALLCFLLLSAGRIDAVRTLSIGALNLETLDLVQDPTEGVSTKRDKYIESTLFRFNDNYIKIIKDWLLYLLNEKHFKKTDPIFPKLVQSETNKAMYVLSNEFYSNSSKINETISRRCKDKGIMVYSAHEFRHLAIDTAFSLARNGMDIKAISQNVGHANLTTTLKQYANMTATEYKKRIKNLKFVQDESSRVCDLSDSELLNLYTKRVQNKSNF